MAVSEKTYTLQQLRRAWAAGRHSAGDVRVGKWLFTFSEHRLGRHGFNGQIVSRLSSGSFVIQLYSWLRFEPLRLEEVAAEEIQSRHLFEDRDDMMNHQMWCVDAWGPSERDWFYNEWLPQVAKDENYDCQAPVVKDAGQMAGQR
jgi:hypothetical protein